MKMQLAILFFQLFNARASTPINAKVRRCLPYAWLSNGWKTTDNSKSFWECKSRRFMIQLRVTCYKEGTQRANPRKGFSPSPAGPAKWPAADPPDPGRSPEDHGSLAVGFPQAFSSPLSLSHAGPASGDSSLYATLSPLTERKKYLALCT